MKIHSLHQLRKEKRKLSEECKTYEKEISVRFAYIQENAATIAVEGIIEAIPHIHIGKILRKMFQQYADKISGGNNKEGGNSLLRAGLSMGLMMGLKYFKAGRKNKE
jgi:hypothetical protein